MSNLSRYIVILSLLISGTAMAQDRSVNFEQGTFNEALSKAKKENKYLFFDAYTSWCGPCKMMTNKVFTQNKVADFFNSNLINIKMDMEKGEGIELGKRFQIGAYPTFLILDEDGKEIHRIVGASEADLFIEKVKKGMNPATSLIGFHERYANGDKNKSFLKEYLDILQQVADRKRLSEVGREYMKMLSDEERFSKEGWKIYGDYYIVGGASGEAFQFVIDNKNKFIAVVGEKAVDDFLYNTFNPYVFGFLSGSAFKSTPYTAARINDLKSKIKKAEISKEQALMVMVDMGDARGRGDIDEYLKLFDKKLPLIPEGEHYRLLLRLEFIKEEGTAKQKKKTVALLQRLVEKQEKDSYIAKGITELQQKLK